MKGIFTIPNIISFFRLVLIPFFAIIYFSDEITYKYFWCIIIVLLSGLSDILDGIIARKCNMVSDLGKILDPIADKLTQVVIVLCLLIYHTELFPLFIILFFKELFTLFAAVYVLSKGIKPISARWWGKLSTIVIFTTMFYSVILDIIPNLTSIPLYILIGLSIICMVISVSGYFKLFSRQVKETPQDDETLL